MNIPGLVENHLSMRHLWYAEFKESGIYSHREVLKLEYKGVVIVASESPSLMLSATGEY